MKRIIIISLFFMGIFSQNCFGQLRVDSVGHVGLGEYGVSFATSEAGSWRKNLYEEYIAGARHGLYSESGDTTAFVWAWGYALDGYSDVKKVNFAVGLKGTAMSKTGEQLAMAVLLAYMLVQVMQPVDITMPFMVNWSMEIMVPQFLAVLQRILHQV